MSTPGELLEALGREARARFGNGGEGATRVYRGRSVEELVPQIQRELGADAIIVRRREGLTGGVLGFFQHPYVEIEAMPGAPTVDVYDEQSHQMPPPPASPPEGEPRSQEWPAPAVDEWPSPSAPAAAAPEPVSAPAPAPSPAPVRMPVAQPDLGARFAPPPAPPTPAAPPTVPPTPAPLASPARAAPPPPPAPAYTTTPPPAPAQEATGSAYVTAHLAALARAGRSTTLPTASTGLWQPTSALPSRPPLSARAPISQRPPGTPRREPPATWGRDLPHPGTGQEPSAGELAQPFAEAQPFAAEIARTAAPPRAAAGERRVVAPGSHGRARAGVARSLQRCGIGEALAQELIDGASAHALALAPRAGLAQAVRSTLAQRIPVAPPLPTEGAVIVMVGAGGTGKTTCAAALLGAYRRGSSLPASCATIMRNPGGAAAGERGELHMILSPYIVKPSPARAPRALRALRRVRGEGVAVVDTPNISPADRAGIRELARLLAEIEPERVVVTLPATLGATAAAQLLQALRPLGANSLAVTHADETDQLGVAVEAACRFALAPEYMLERASNPGRADRVVGAAGGGWRLRHMDPTALAEKLLP